MPATTLSARICIRPVLSPFLYFPYAGLTFLLYRILGYLSLLYNQLISFSVSLDYGSYDPCVPPSATRQRHHMCGALDGVIVLTSGLSASSLRDVSETLSRGDGVPYCTCTLQGVSPITLENVLPLIDVSFSVSSRLRLVDPLLPPQKGVPCNRFD